MGVPHKTNLISWLFDFERRQQGPKAQADRGAADRYNGPDSTLALGMKQRHETQQVCTTS